MSGDDAEVLDPLVADRQALARDAVIWGFPLLMLGRYLDAAETADFTFNRFYMNTEVATAKSHAIGPNIDTLNGRAWLDLDAGPQVIGVPDTADRYYSVQLQDMYMNSFAFIGRRTTGTKAGFFAITPPGYAGRLPTGLGEIRATTSRVLLFVRMLVRGPSDLARATALNASFTLGPLAAFPQGQATGLVASGAIEIFQPAARRASRTLPHDEMARSGAGYFDALDRLIRRFPPLPDDAPHLARFAPLGLGRPRTPEWREAMAAAVPQGIAAAQQGLVSWLENGWSRRPNVVAFITDPLQRAANNIFGPNTQVAEESVFYNKRQGPDGKTLSGASRYRLRFLPGQTPPVDAFWSLTLYDKNYNLYDNPLDRYGITDHSGALRERPDGTVDIQIQHEPPTDDDVNWLPAPPDEFQLIIRAYQPRAEILDSSYQPPPLEILPDATP